MDRGSLHMRQAEYTGSWECNSKGAVFSEIWICVDHRQATACLWIAQKNDIVFNIVVFVTIIWYYLLSGAMEALGGFALLLVG